MISSLVSLRVLLHFLPRRSLGEVGPQAPYKPISEFGFSLELHRSVRRQVVRFDDFLFSVYCQLSTVCYWLFSLNAGAFKE